MMDHTFTLPRILDRAEALFGASLAVKGDNLGMTYGQLADRVARLAAALRNMGLSKGDRVALLARNSFRYLEINLACARAGLILVPLNFRLSEPEIARILHESGSTALLRALPFNDAGISALAWDDADPMGADTPYENLIRDSAPMETHVPCGVDDIAQIFFTSGTTGLPKGVCLTHGNLVASALDSVICMELRERDVWLHASPMFHLVDAFSVWAITLVGARHVFAHFAPDSFAATVEAERITKSSLPPTLLDMIAKSPATTNHDVSSLDLISYGGSPMSKSVYGRVKAALKCKFLQAYGVTEGGGLVCHQLPGEETAEGADYVNSAGRPALHIDLAIVDDAGAPVGPFAVGEILMAGARVMGGYWRNPDETARAMRGGWYHTGDLGMMDERGAVTIMGRKKDMIITGGENVYPAEVEGVLLGHADVVEAAVFGLPSEVWGEEVQGAVLLRPGATTTPEALIQHCRAQIGGYKVPKKIHISSEELPKSGPGKIAKAQVRARYLEGEA